MPIRFKCKKCGKSARAEMGQAGKKARCMGCGNLIIIPLPGVAPLPPVESAETIKGERCADCGEIFMPHRIVDDAGKLRCRPCWGKRHDAGGVLLVVQHDPPPANDSSTRSLVIWLSFGAGMLLLFALLLLLLFR